jgi:hypothetical protein
MQNWLYVNKLLHTESATRYKYNMQVEMGYSYIDKESWRQKKNEIIPFIIKLSR